MDAKRGILIAGNWKMNHGPKAAREFAQALHGLTAGSPQVTAKLTSGSVRARVIPPALSLPAALEAFAGSPVSVACQNVHWEEKGAFTGEVSGSMLREIGVHSTLVGHSERRQYFGETDETAKKRAESHLMQGFDVIFCYGETRAEREGGKTEAVLERQLANGLPSAWSEKLILAYEPVWAIGTGLTATPEQAEEAHAFSRRILEKTYGADAANRTPILYGGSVTPENLPDLLRRPNVDGGLVGGASLKPESFFALLAAATATGA